MSLFCMFFLFCVFQTTHLPQKAQLWERLVAMTGTLFEVLLGLAYFLWEKRKDTSAEYLVRVSMGHEETHFGVRF